MEERKSPYGILIPGRINHFPAGIVGNREYLLALKEAIEKALDGGIGCADVFAPDGEGHYLFIKLEEDTDKIPVLYADFWGTKEIDGDTYVATGYAFYPEEWSKAVNLLDDLEKFYFAWKRIYENLNEFLFYIFFEKCFKEFEKKNKSPVVCVRLYHRFLKLANRLLYDEKGHRKLPTPAEWRRFFSKLWRLKVPDYCLRTIIYGDRKEVRICVDLSLKLVKNGLPNGALEGVGLVGKKDYPNLPDGEYFLFLKRASFSGKVNFDGAIEDGRRVFIPVNSEEYCVKIRIEKFREEDSYEFPVGFIADREREEYCIFPLSSHNLAGHLREVIDLLAGKKGTLYFLPSLQREKFVKVSFKHCNDIPKKLINGNEVNFSELPERIRRNVVFLLRGEKERLFSELLPSERERVKKLLKEVKDE